ncbi:PorV/PorQ family protein [candidate division KSB1 bacterium]|nr:PorV/PorQ family protein [candidate division KSB1 bacterium]RQW00764.1 MAG: PorV/PorQ family protein [candidate division KSB1 bacterium]
MKTKNIFLMIYLSLFLTLAVTANEPYRVGTTAASFLEIGFGSTGAAMGDAAVASVEDLSAIYWNPGRLPYIKQSEAQFMYQPWIADINTSFTAVGIKVQGLGTFAAGLYQVAYGDMKVTTMQQQDGTGEMYSANDYAFSLSYGRKLAHWFAFGASAKYVAQKIWHSQANAFAFDLGMVVDTDFFSPTGDRADGLTIGMSIANYGTRMRFDGMDLLQPIDLYPFEAGNYAYAEGQFKMQEWELPLIFRIGAAIHPIASAKQRLTLEVDALHPNNNSESVNLGAQYRYTIPSFGDFYLRGGYKALFMVESQYGATFGAGLKYILMNNLAIRIDYSYRDIGLLGKMHAYTFSVLF